MENLLNVVLESQMKNKKKSIIELFKENSENFINKIKNEQKSVDVIDYMKLDNYGIQIIWRKNKTIQAFLVNGSGEPLLVFENNKNELQSFIQSKLNLSQYNEK